MKPYKCFLINLTLFLETIQMLFSKLGTIYETIQLSYKFRQMF